MGTNILYPPLSNGLQKALSSQLDAGVTASASLANVTGIPNLPGTFVIDRIDTNGDEKDATLREYIEYDGTSGSTLTTLVRGRGGSSDQVHLVGAVVEFVPDVTWGTRVAEALATVVTDADHQVVNTTNVVTPTGSQTLTNKTLTSPTINTPTIATPTVTDGTFTDATLTTPVIDVGSDATGDLLFRDSGALARLAIGTAGQFLTTDGSTPSWGDVSSSIHAKTGSLTRAINASNANVAYTGLGFTPKAVLFLSGVNNAQGWSIGFDDGVSPFCIAFPTSGTVVRLFSNSSVQILNNSDWAESGTIASFDADGFTITWVAGGSPPSGTLTVYYIAIR